MPAPSELPVPQPRRIGISPAAPLVGNAASLLPQSDGYIRRVTQLAVEAVVYNTAPNVRLTQEAIEVPVRSTAPHTRITQTVVEVPLRVLNPKARLTQEAVEVVTKVQHEIVFITWVDG